MDFNSGRFYNWRSLVCRHFSSVVMASAENETADVDADDNNAQEYEALVTRMSDYYEAKKRLIDMKKKNILKKYEAAILVQQLQVLKSEFHQQKRNWQTLTASYA